MPASGAWSRSPGPVLFPPLPHLPRPEPAALLDLDALIRSLPARIEPEALLTGFVPPPRFRDKHFADYQPDPRYASQAEAVRRLSREAASLQRPRGLRRWLGGARVARTGGGGLYLDGGFGVGKTHLLAALWNSATVPKLYLSFDELMYTIGLLGVGRVGAAASRHRLICVDEWELDDPGNLKLALAFLRGTVPAGVRVAATSNTLPDELGRGRFSQKSFTAEMEELSAAFQVVRVDGEDYRHRHYSPEPGREHFVTPAALGRLQGAARRVLRVHFPLLLQALQGVHPVHFAGLAARLDLLLLEDLRPIPSLPEALRWVHLIDKLYDQDVQMAATATVGLGELFPAAFVAGPFGKKLSRCLSRMEEMLGTPVEKDLPRGPEGPRGSGPQWPAG